MVAEIPYMIVWGFFSAMGWMGASWTVEKAFPDKEKDKPAIVQTEKEVQVCSNWEEKDNGDGTRTKNRTCNFLKD